MTGEEIIKGSCHCGNIRYSLRWPGSTVDIIVRECGCTFCQKHGGAWTSHREAKLAAEVADMSMLSKYRFGTSTADFFVCSRCGAVPFVASEIDDHLYAVANVNTFDNVDTSVLARTNTSFDGEETTDRLGRRQRNWIPNIQIAES